jgi:hypothetical protein
VSSQRWSKLGSVGRRALATDLGKGWGSQPVRRQLAANSDSSHSAQGDQGPQALGSPSLNGNVTDILACGSLTWDDVRKVEFG